MDTKLMKIMLFFDRSISNEKAENYNLNIELLCKNILTLFTSFKHILDYPSINSYCSQMVTELRSHEFMMNPASFGNENSRMAFVASHFLREEYKCRDFCPNELGWKTSRELYEFHKSINE